MLTIWAGAVMEKIGKGVALMLGCLLLLASPAFATGLGKPSAFAHEYSETLPPIGFVEF